MRQLCASDLSTLKLEKRENRMQNMPSFRLWMSQDFHTSDNSLARTHAHTWKLTAAVEKIKLQFLSHSHAGKQSHNLLTVVDFVRLL